MNYGIGNDAIVYSLTGINIPAINIKAEAIKYGGGNVYVSSHTKTPYDPFKIKFKVANDYSNYLTMYEWINLIYDENKGHFDGNDLTDVATFKGYVTNMAIIGLNEYNDTKHPVIQWLFTNAFPTDLSGINFSYTKGTPDEIECEATFVFSQMKITIPSTDYGKV